MIGEDEDALAERRRKAKETVADMTPLGLGKWASDIPALVGLAEALGSATTALTTAFSDAVFNALSPPAQKSAKATLFNIVDTSSLSQLASAGNLSQEAIAAIRTTLHNTTKSGFSMTGLNSSPYELAKSLSKCHDSIASIIAGAYIEQRLPEDKAEALAIQYANAIVGEPKDYLESRHLASHLKSGLPTAGFARTLFTAQAKLAGASSEPIPALAFDATALNSAATMLAEARNPKPAETQVADNDQGKDVPREKLSQLDAPPTPGKPEEKAQTTAKA